MAQNKKQLSASGMTLLITVLLNAIILETAYTGNKGWYWALFVSLPFLLLAIIGRRQKKQVANPNYPLARHMRSFFKFAKPEKKPYIFESYMNSKLLNKRPQSAVYQHATNEMQKE